MLRVFFNEKEEKMKKNLFILVSLILFFPGLIYGQNLQFGLAASSNVIEANAEFSIQQPLGLICVGGGISHHEQDYSIGNLLFCLKTSRLTPDFKYGLGFKGVFGKVEDEDNIYDDTLAAVGFWFGVDYALKPSANPVNMPIEFFTDICFAPGSLSFEDSSQYAEIKAGTRLWIIDSACILISCRYTDIEFEPAGHSDWDRDDFVLLGGISVSI